MKIIQFFLIIILISFANCWTMHMNNINYPEHRKPGFFYNKNKASDDGIAKGSRVKRSSSSSWFFPGTKWCGTGNRARDYSDLGSNWQADMCCREHDYCDNYIVGKGSKYGLYNDAEYSRLSCECDEKFRKCLQRSNTRSGYFVGDFYFNRLSTQCFRLDYPVLKCRDRRKGWWYLRASKCLKRQYDIYAKKTYQWFDVPDY